MKMEVGSKTAKADRESGYSKGMYSKFKCQIYVASNKTDNASRSPYRPL
jgi:hypothetical protein